MVLLHIKREEETQFLYEAPAAAAVDVVLAEVVQVQNQVQRIRRLCLEGGELLRYGSARPPEEAAKLREADALTAAEKLRADGAPLVVDTPMAIKREDEAAREALNAAIASVPVDPTHRRNGGACNGEAAAALSAALHAADALVDKGRVNEKHILTNGQLEAAIHGVRVALATAYPGGLPEWDLVRRVLEATEELEGTAHAGDEMRPAGAELWFVRRRLELGHPLSDFLGRNDKTRATLQLQPAGRGPPPRQQPKVDEATQREMMAWHYKKQEEQKALLENKDDDYLNSSWANPKALKLHFHGVTEIRLR